ncbi:MAG: class II fructose-1,6-bisphosphate aldolase [Selenomonas sp.]|jgi:fructose-bisphosphate aldolase class II|nr:class II fructose-1,6-bisphosphate aldolase [Selenomonas sp.]
MPLVGTKEMFKKAYEGGYAIGAFNVNNMEIVQGITEAAAELNSPVILQASAGARKYAKGAYLRHLVLAALEVNDIPVALHLDHGPDFETCKACIDDGFTSVMYDGSKYDFKENIKRTQEVVAYAHEHGVVVEAELGKLAGIEDDVKVAAHDAAYTQPEEVEEFVKETGVDSLAIAIGTSHGAFKFKPEQCTRNADGVLVPPELRFDILAEIEKKIPEFPIVLHGASSVIPKYVKIINANGGKLDDAVGIPEDQLRRAAKSAVCKINIDSDLRLAMTAGIREHFMAHPEHFDPRQYVADGRSYIKELVEHKIKDVLGSDGKAPEIMELVNANK